MIEGKIHLSSDRKRLGYVKLLVMLTSPRTRNNKETLIKKYRRTIEDHHDYEWNQHSIKGKLPGRGMGASKKNEHTDSIALNHLTLAQNLEFLKKDVPSWGKNGYILASLYCDQDGEPKFFNSTFLKEELMKKGFIAEFGPGEQLVFSTALIENDFDRIIPLMLALSEYSTATDLEEHFLSFVDIWLAKKYEIETRHSIKYKIRIEEKEIQKKISRLQIEENNKSNLSSRAPSVKTYVREQVSPRLHFLQDIDYIQKDKKRYVLTNKCWEIKNTLIDPLFDSTRVAEEIKEKLENSSSLLSCLIDVGTKDFSPILFERFKTYFSITSSFYKRSGALLLDYFNVFKAISCKAIDNSERLSLDMFSNYLSQLSEQEDITVSTSGRGTKYIRVPRNF